MSDKENPKADSGSRRANPNQSTIAAGDGDNPQDDKDTGRSGDSRPRGKTEDPERTL